MNWLGTDDQARDVTARMIYGFRISVLFGLTLTVLSALIGIAAGAVQGYFGGWTDLMFQRFIEIWTSTPSALHHLIIISAMPSAELLAPGDHGAVRLDRRSWAWCGRNSCARATSNTCARRGRWAWATGRSCSATSCPTRWWRR
jgi:ABC-type dipeptide/oligopeptide/nickel transport system permease subunit